MPVFTTSQSHAHLLNRTHGAALNPHGTRAPLHVHALHAPRSTGRLSLPRREKRRDYSVASVKRDSKMLPGLCSDDSHSVNCGRYVFGSMLVNDSSSTPYSDATQVGPIACLFFFSFFFRFYFFFIPPPPAFFSN